jgi:hypothetical protein
MPGATVWRSESEPLQVISAVEAVEDPEVGLIVPSFHVSALAIGPGGRPARACTDAELDRVREAFQMDGADEDNHGRGLARHLWLRVGARVEDPCACKQDEPTAADGPRLWRP